MAQRVILAANGGNMGLHPALARSAVPLNVREVATWPVPEEIRDTVLPHGHALTDRGPDIFTIRYDASGRLITAATMPWVRSWEALERAVNARLRQVIPNWTFLPLDNAWTGTAWLNIDAQPRFVKPEPGVLAIQACNGRGVALAGPVGRDAAHWAIDPAAPLGLPVITPRPVPAYAITSRLPKAAMMLAAIKNRVAA